MFIRTGELDDALAALDEQLMAEPADDEAMRLRARVRAVLPDGIASALLDWEALPGKTPADHAQIAILYERAGDMAQALHAMHTAHTSAPHDERIAEQYTTLLWQTTQWEQALTVVRNQPSSWRWQQWEGDLLAELGELEEAEACYSQAIAEIDSLLAGEPNPTLAAIKGRLLLVHGHCYRRLGQPDRAEACYLAAARILPEDPLIDFNRGLCYALRADEATALHLCQPVWRHLANRRDDLRQALAEHPVYQPLYDALLRG